jgi:2-polyprenyl-6-methoxyphenol hydroxylase-like FAD-dependent oxidoreductase
MSAICIEAQYDTVVVGARVAGASTAMLLARAGQRVLMIEKSAAGSDTTSTHALMRAGVMQLNRWGLLDRVIASGAPAIRTSTFHYGKEAIEILIQERYGVDALYAPRRTELDSILVNAAMESGAEIIHGATVEGVLHSSGRATGVEFRDARGNLHSLRAGMVIGADGARSVVARSVNSRVVREGHHRCALVYGYWHGLELNGTHWYYGQDVAGGAIPTHDGSACVFVAMRPERYESARGGIDALFAQVLEETDAPLARMVERGVRVGKLHPFAGRTGFIREAWGPGWALVGDASCFKDPLTAHGMTDALRDAELLAHAVLMGTDEAFARYTAGRDALAHEFLELSDEVGSFNWDFGRVKELHHRLSRLMSRECDLVNAFGPIPAGALL